MVSSEDIVIIKEENHHGNVAGFTGPCLVIPTQSYSESELFESSIRKAIKLWNLVYKNIQIYDTDIITLQKNLNNVKDYITSQDIILDHEKLDRIMLRQKVLKELLKLID